MASGGLSVTREFGLLPDLFMAQGFSAEVVGIIDDFMEIREPILLHVVRRVGERRSALQRSQMRSRLMALQGRIDGARQKKRYLWRIWKLFGGVDRRGG